MSISNVDSTFFTVVSLREIRKPVENMYFTKKLFLVIETATFVT